MHFTALNIVVIFAATLAGEVRAMNPGHSRPPSESSKISMQTSSNLASANSGSMLTGISETHSGSDISSGPILTWTEAEAKGKELMLQLDKALLGNSSDKAASTIKELKGHWVIKNAGTKRSSEFENLNKYSAAFNFDRELIPFLLYQNAIDQEGRFLIAVNNLRGDGETIHWSDMAFSVWQKEVPYPASLKYVVRHNIENSNTLKIIQEAYRLAGRAITENLHWWTKVDPQYYALIGTVNGKGVAWMLTDYSHTLGRKTIGRIGTAKSEEESLHIVFELISADSELGVNPGTSSAGTPFVAKGGSTSRSPSTASPPRQQPRMQRRMQAFPRGRGDPSRLLRRSEAQTACLQQVYNNAQLNSRSAADQMSFPNTDTELANCLRATCSLGRLRSYHTLQRTGTSAPALQV